MIRLKVIHHASHKIIGLNFFDDSVRSLFLKLFSKWQCFLARFSMNILCTYPINCLQFLSLMVWFNWRNTIIYHIVNGLAKALKNYRKSSELSHNFYLYQICASKEFRNCKFGSFSNFTLLVFYFYFLTWIFIIHC